MPTFCRTCLYLENPGTAAQPRQRCVLWEIWDPGRLPDEACDAYEPDGEVPTPAESGAAAQGGAR